MEERQETPEEAEELHEEEATEPSPLIKGGWLRAILILPAFIIVQQIFSMVSLGIVHASMELPLQSIQTALKSGNWPSLLLVHQGLGLIGTLLLIALFRLKIDRKSLGSMGLKLRPSPFLTGLLLGPLLIGICFLTLHQLGHIGFRWAGINPYYFGIYFMLAILIALNEELLVRGYMLNNMMRSMRGPYALLITAAIFTGLHAINPSITWVSVLNLLLAGMLLGVTYLKDQQLAFPIGLHLSWNFAQGPLFGFHVSGMKLNKGAMLETWTVEGSPSYLTGGDFGLEGSLLLSALQITLIPLLYKVWKKKQ